MLEFSKLSANIGELEEGREVVNIKTSFSVANDGLLMVSTRLIDSKGYRLMSKLDGTIGDMAMKVNSTCSMTNDMFKTFSTIQFGDTDAN